jgi:hypothetical protein
LREKHRALGALESSLAGRYNEGNKLGGILTRLYLGKYLYGEVGIINSISYDIPNDSSWDLDEQLAHNINVSINFTVIHNALPTYKSEGGLFNPGDKINIKNGADGFISSAQALNKTGAEGDITYNLHTPVTREPNNKKRDTAIINNIQSSISNITGNDVLNQVLSEQGAPEENIIKGLKGFFGK